jgi:hypothetical protein
MVVRKFGRGWCVYYIVIWGGGEVVETGDVIRAACLAATVAALPAPVAACQDTYTPRHACSNYPGPLSLDKGSASNYKLMTSAETSRRAMSTVSLKTLSSQVACRYQYERVSHAMEIT